ncbi:MAG: DUF885 family protein, partial [Candidatus Eremiobacteraeota bacterium]|nr:DUF885 family protein [Candidatus Eremiobacteraeota bacterium]
MRILAALLLVIALGAATPMSQSQTANQVDELGARYFARQLQNDYYLRTELGKPVETIRPLSLANAQDDAAFAQEILDGLKSVDPATLDHDRWLTYRTLQYLASNDVAGAKYFWLRQQATPYAGGSVLGEFSTIFATFTFKDAADAQRYVALLKQYAAYVGSIGDLLEGQHRRGIILPDIETDAAQAVFAGYSTPDAT